MTELKLVRNAAVRLHRFCLAVLIALLSVAIAITGFLSASSNNNGANSTLDHYLGVNTSGVSGQYAQGPSTEYPNLSANATWELWLQPTSFTSGTGGKNYLSKENSFTFGINSGTYQWALHNGSGWVGWVDTQVQARLNAWTHVAWVKSGTSISLYIDGKLAYQANSAPSTLAQNSNPLRVGDRVNTEFFQGGIDELRVWDVARSTEQISANVHRRLVGNEAGLRGYWDFNEPTGTGSVFDRSGVGQALTLVGNPLRVDVKTLSTVGGETIVSFPRTYLPGVGGWTTPTTAVNARVLVVGAGAGADRGIGSVFWGHGGGGGEVLETPVTLQLNSVVSVQVGQGGEGRATSGSGLRAGNGQSSTFSNITARGGQSALNTNDPAGSFGGTSGNGNTGGGNNVRSSPCTVTNNFCEAGGGGGAGGPGNRMNGGPGVLSSISGTLLDYGGGGAGRNDNGYGTASSSAATQVSNVFRAAPPNRGGGGTDFAADGGSGVVIVRYTTIVDAAADLQGQSSQYFVGTAGTVASGPFTMEIWANIRSMTRAHVLLSQSVDTSNQIYLVIGRDNVATPYEFLVGWGNASVWTDVTVPSARWFHAAVTRDASGIARLYLDGALVWTSTTQSTTNATTGTFSVGAHSNGDESLDGQVDQVKVWNAALSQTEISNSMHSYGATQSDGVAIRSGAVLRAHFDFNDYQSSGVELNRGSGTGLDLRHASAISSTTYTDSQIVQTATVFGNQTVLRFQRTYLTALGGWTPPGGVNRFKALAVGGGGAGGTRHGGGGGAGALLWNESITLSGVTRIQVGQGGLG
ncbi:MAG: LamG domain-containing protein, partial [Actinobacteria bacterium]|nr:LamG domain-containing protein [Actinomycetota bacterium]